MSRAYVARGGGERDRADGVGGRRAYEDAEGFASPAEEMLAMVRHIRAVGALAELDEASLARGAAHLATVFALRLAATPVGSNAEHERVVATLRWFVGLAEPARRRDLASLLDAGLQANVDRGISVGLRPFGDPRRDWLNVIDEVVDGPPLTLMDGDQVTREDVEHYAAMTTARDVDYALATSIGVVRRLAALPPGGKAAAGAWAVLEGMALGLCVEPAGSHEARHDARRVLLILWRTLRRRSPLAAAVLRRRLALDRGRWPGPVR